MNMATANKKTSGGCIIHRTSPNRSQLNGETKALNVIISFPEALRLGLALQDCLLKLNSLKMSTVAGKKAAVNLCIHFDVDRIQILTGKLTD